MIRTLPDMISGSEKETRRSCVALLLSPDTPPPVIGWLFALSLLSPAGRTTPHRFLTSATGLSMAVEMALHVIFSDFNFTRHASCSAVQSGTGSGTLVGTGSLFGADTTGGAGSEHCWTPDLVFDFLVVLSLGGANTGPVVTLWAVEVFFAAGCADRCIR